MVYSLGNYNFEEVLKNGDYVDKTKIIDEIMEMGVTESPIVAVRPRRFGKSLMLSMLKTFFDIEGNSKTLFKDLYIASSKHFSEINSHPVIAISFKDFDEESYERTLFSVKAMMAKQLRRFDDESLLNCLEKEEREFVNAILGDSIDETALEHSLLLLTKLSYAKYGKKAFVFIDEYDLPISTAYLCSYFKEASAFFKKLYSLSLKGNSCLRLAVLTGVMNNAKDSLSSGLNNVVLDNGLYSAFKEEYFGFDEEEVSALLRKAGRNDSTDDLAAWYGGYHFNNQIVFNPWSVLNFLSSQGKYLVYWANTGSSAMIKDALEHNRFFSESLLLDLMNGKAIDISSDFSFSYADVNSSRQGAIVELASLGYLTAIYDYSRARVQAKIPNREILEVFRNEIHGRYIEPNRIDDGLSDLRLALLEGRAEVVESALRRIVSGFSYYSFKDFRNYQILVLALTSTLLSDYSVREEIPTGEGRCDILLCPKTPGAIGAIIEVKSLQSKTTEERLLASAKAALRQISSRHYHEILRDQGAAPIYGYGISFHQKQVAVVGEKLD